MVILRPEYHTKLMTRVGLYPENLPLGYPLHLKFFFFPSSFLTRTIDGIYSNG